MTFVLGLKYEIYIYIYIYIDIFGCRGAFKKTSILISFDIGIYATTFCVKNLQLSVQT